MKKLLLFLFLSTTLFATNITVVTMAVGKEYQKAVAPGIRNKQTYCDKHGYEFVYSTDWLDPSRPIAWSKVLLLLQVMEESESEWLFWTDADSLVMNLAIPLEDFIDEKYDLIIASDVKGINSGQYLIRNCEKTKQFLINVYAHDEHIDYKTGQRPWDQQGFIVELEENVAFRERTKILPQRLMNSYPFSKRSKRIPTMHYQTGDFIQHFAGYRNLTGLRFAMISQSKKTIDSLTAIAIDSYLNIYGFELDHRNSENNIGYISPQQQVEFTQRLRELPHIQSVAEIGLNGGHSLLHIMKCCPNLKRVLSFDINTMNYTPVAVEFFNRFYGDQFSFVEGDSSKTVPDYVGRHKEKYDLIYIDGNHSYQGCLHDILNCKDLAHTETVLWIDDYFMHSVKLAVDECVKKRIIKIEKNHLSGKLSASGYNRSARCWVEARYLPHSSNPR